MELKEFVAQAITEISRGIIQAQKDNPEILLAPHVGMDGVIATYKNDREKPQLLHFDLTITVTGETEDADRGGNFSLQVASVSVSAGKSKQEGKKTSSTTEQKISFDIPVVWPTAQKQEEPPFPSRGVRRDAYEG